jgi:hypothetical protein
VWIYSNENSDTYVEALCDEDRDKVDGLGLCESVDLLWAGYHLTVAVHETRTRRCVIDCIPLLTSVTQAGLKVRTSSFLSDSQLVGRKAIFVKHHEIAEKAA